MKIFFLLCLLALVGCTSFSNMVRDRASFDLNCPVNQISVQEITGEAYGAKGCNQRASYNCFGQGFLNRFCVKGSENIK